MEVLTRAGMDKIGYPSSLASNKESQQERQVTSISYTLLIQVVRAKLLVSSGVPYFIQLIEGSAS